MIKSGSAGAGKVGFHKLPVPPFACGRFYQMGK